MSARVETRPEVGAAGRSNSIERAGLIAGIVLALALVAPLRGYLTDDTFIHLQYARHLAHGEGLVFNLGERVYGCTSPLWVGLLALGIASGLDGLMVARAIGLAATLLSIGLFWELMRRSARTSAVIAAATIAWAANAWMLRWSLSGMETPLAVLLVLAGFLAFTGAEYVGQRAATTGALWALAALTRPEAVLLLLLWGADLVIRPLPHARVRRVVAGAWPAAALYGSWLLFARGYFGRFWPETLAAKSAGGAGIGGAVSSLWRQVKIVGATDGVLLALLAVSIAIAWRRGAMKGMASRAWLALAWLAGLPLLYVARGVPVISRYLVPVLPVLAWLAWNAAERGWLEQPGPERPPAGPRRVAAAATVVAALVLAQNLAVYRGAVLPQVTSFTAGLERSLIPWGRWFAQNTSPEDRIGTPDIGALGYFSQRRVLDLAGLVSPGMIPLLERTPEEAVIASFAFSGVARPAYLVDRAASPLDLMRRSPYAACLTPLGHAQVPNLGIARPGAVTYTFYRVDWERFDSLGTRR